MNFGWRARVSSARREERELALELVIQRSTRRGGSNANPAPVAP